MKYLLLFSVVLALSCDQLVAQKRIVICGQLLPGLTADTAELEIAPQNYIGNAPEWEHLKQPVVNGRARFVINTSHPIILYSNSFFKKRSSPLLFEPGDSISIVVNNGKPTIVGRGSNKINVLLAIEESKKTVEKPVNPLPFTIYSLQDYIEYSDYLNMQLNVVLPLIDKEKKGISENAYKYIRSNTIAYVEYDRLLKFWGLKANAIKFGLTGKDLNAIFDSTLNSYQSRWIRSLSDQVDHVLYFYAFNRTESFRKFDFNDLHDSLKSDNARRLVYYPIIKTKYKGLVREKLLVWLLTYETIKEIGFSSVTKKLLADYYSSSGYPDYKNWVKQFEAKARKLRDGSITPDFSLKNAEGKTITKNELKGKVVLMDFWFTGCIGCMETTPVIKKIEECYKEDTNFVVVSVCTDKDKKKWMQSVAQGKYTTDHGLHVYTDGKGADHSMLTDYNVVSYPTLYLLDASGRIVQNPLPGVKSDNGKKLSKLIEKQLAILHDGPYLIYGDSNIIVYRLHGASVVRENYNDKAKVSINVQTDSWNETFPIRLKTSIIPEPSEFSDQGKVFVLSDIEGNFDALRRMLQNHGVIDDAYNWTYGNGHLVFNGDIFDRGEQVTECLWLIYSLEDKAKAAGGYVHFVLGNHEIMNLNSDLRYLQNKYLGNLEKLKISYNVLYGRDAELGRWLRSKNIIEKIGNYLFVHGGISNEVNDMNLSIAQINKLARQFYDQDSLAKKSDQKDIRILYDSKHSPFWYRLYYQEQEIRMSTSGELSYKPSHNDIDRTLARFKVGHIVTGHTIVEDTISTHYGGKVINTDTRHASGKSEALIIENGNLFRGTLNGDIIPLSSPVLYLSGTNKK